MARVWIGVVFVVAALVAGIAAQAAFDAERQSLPSRTGRPDGGRLTGPPAPVAVTGADPSTTGELVVVVTYLDALEQERLEREQIDAYLAALEATRLADLEAQRMAQARQAAGPPAPSRGTSTPTGCDGHVVPAYIVQRESGCDYGAVNPTGCGGNGCVGLYQFDTRHFTSGACSDLDWHSPADQDECARRLSNGGTNLAPWGG
jgi:hypothetical protein